MKIIKTAPSGTIEHLSSTTTEYAKESTKMSIEQVLIKTDL